MKRLSIIFLILAGAVATTVSVAALGSSPRKHAGVEPKNTRVAQPLGVQAPAGIASQIVDPSSLVTRGEFMTSRGQMTIYYGKALEVDRFSGNPLKCVVAAANGSAIALGCGVEPLRARNFMFVQSAHGGPKQRTFLSLFGVARPSVGRVEAIDSVGNPHKANLDLSGGFFIELDAAQLGAGLSFERLRAYSKLGALLEEQDTR
jgi:hypothetical protein